MKRLNIIQFLPYFPPHKGGLETHAKQFGEKYRENNFGDVINIITDFDQKDKISKENQITFEGKSIGYIEKGVENLIVPSFEIISNFPMYKIWSKEYKLIKQYLKTKKTDIVITRTRFFLTSLIGGLFARKNNLKWCHIEHGSDYVKLNSKFKSFIAKIYDKIIGKWIFKKADKLVGVSNACKDFVQKEFINKKVEVIYRGMQFDLKSNEKVENLKESYPGKIIVGFIGRLYKWKNIDTLIKAYYDLDENIKDKIQIVVVGEGEDFERLNKIDTENKLQGELQSKRKHPGVYFTGGKSFQEAINLQKQFDIHFHTSSPGGGLATTLLQAMNLGCFIVSTPYEGAKEVVEDNKNGILLKNDSLKELKKGLIAGINSLDKKENYSRENKKIIETKFNWNENIKKYYNLFNR
ncbi:glycosyltransferase family 4 protein [Candidatus Vampirococcus lugosii]|uniref:Glycosyltransferase n=1 Tax=Candidatus Vampirococcus lugosii TaxID=2789015 RepID=A0ABS5QLK4_9BACT|nr:glycosyltransferase family 4 protein [Candidatus Vampirococcus lugosii]MBS8122062.1 glycosyltransferase [Candidatus Vampirococcus lugosii]